MQNKITFYTVFLLRISMGWIFLWAFFDKLFGLGFATKTEQSWLHGISPTTGFLKFGTDDLFRPLFISLSGNTFTDWLFMIGLFAIGISLLLGVGIKIATTTGSLLLLLIYFALFPPEHNPFLDEHIIYILVLLLLANLDIGNYFGLSKWWSNRKLVKKYPFLK